MFFPRWWTSSVNYVKDFWTKTLIFFLTYAALTVKYDLTYNFLECDGLIFAIRNTKGTSENVATQGKTFGQLLKSNEFSKIIYKLIVTQQKYESQIFIITGNYSTSCYSLLAWQMFVSCFKDRLTALFPHG